MPDFAPRTSAPEDPDGFGLACKHCGHLFPADVTMPVAGAHMEIEHGVDDIQFELAVLCPRDSGAMTFVRQEAMHDGGIKSWWDCPRCHRTRVVAQGPKEADRG